MPAFGENLRREREMRGVSLEEISGATKISLRFLDAIEREDFTKLPGGIFSRSFIRSYARYLGLDEERVVAEYQLAARPQVEFDLHRMPAGSPNVGRRPARNWLIPTVLAVLLLAGGYALFRYTSRTSEAQAPSLPPPMPVTTPKPAAPEAAPAPPAAGETPAAPGTPPAAGGATPEATPGAPGAVGTPAAPNAAAHPDAGTAPGANPTTPPAAIPEKPTAITPAIDSDLVLQVAVTDRTWISADADGKTVLQRALDPNEVVTLKAHKSFTVTTGNAQSTILTLNGETLKPLGRSGEVKTVHLTRDDLKNPAP